MTRYSAIPKLGISEKKRLRLFLLLVFFTSTNLSAQHWKYPDAVDEKMEQVLNFMDFGAKFPEKMVITSTATPLDLLPVSVKLMLDAMLINTSESVLEATRINTELLDRVENFKNKSAEWGYVKTRLLLNKTVLHALQGEYFSTLWTFYQTFSLLAETMDKHPGFPPLHTLASLFNKGLAATKEYDTKLTCLLPNPIKVNPELMIGPWSKVEKPLFESFNIIFEEKPELPAKWTITTVTQAEKLVYVVYFLNMRYSPKALELLSVTTNSQSPVDAFLFGWANLTLGKYADAKSRFEEHLESTQSVILKRASILGLYYISIIEGKKVTANTWIEKAEKFPDSKAYRDRVAKRELETMHNPKLLKARLLFDGHLFSEAAEILQSIDLNSLGEEFKLEYYYRRGRICMQQQELREALQFFQKALDPTLPEKSYYKAQSAFDSGEIFKRLKDTENARKQYDLSIQLAKNAMREDIENKARRALKEMNY